MRIVITGAAGFIGTNLQVRLRELGVTDVVGLTRHDSEAVLREALSGADFVFHLAAANRPVDPADFARVNAGLTQSIVDTLTASGRAVPVVFTSSSQAAADNAYGLSKRRAEDLLRSYAARSGAALHIFRLCNVFGKWARPFYNSAVATFCHQIAQGLEPTVHNPSAPLRLVHVDDVVDALIACLPQSEPPEHSDGFSPAGPEYDTSVGEVAALLQSFAASRQTLLTDHVGVGLTRALYSTYVSYLSPDKFSYEIPRHSDSRGDFVEMLKTPDCGQFSYFTARPGVTRGEHYHHSKTEKFLVLRGHARFGFRHIVTGERHALDVHGGEGRIVETAPGWTHDIRNVGADDLIVMLWANEVFDPSRPDTVALKVDPDSPRC